VQVIVGDVWKSEPPLGGPVSFDRAGCPDFEGTGVGEEVPIAKAEAVREPASRRQRAKLWMEALSVQYEDRLVFTESHPPLQAIRLVRLEIFRLLLALQAVGFFARRRFLWPGGVCCPGQSWAGGGGGGFL